ncbi:VOC family protein [Novosphingobium sp. 2580]|uniref:VOC family protein n=2 Tax=Novosphingobium album (ex Hu et al. 2023) TaxID=2930093 RepID=A0ABT0AWT0_9SPHN|nr:VOC family protein [Novosphingobium album (ex Hu et al. 2023)]
MLAWYATVFGAEVVYRNPVLAFLAFDEEHHRFAFADLSVIDPDGSDAAQAPVGVDHVAYDVASMRDLLESYALLKDAGIAPYWAVNHGMSTSLYYADPDGNQIEFSVDCFDTKAEGTDYWSGPEIGNNPVGVEYDPDLWLEALRNGTPERELLKIDTSGSVSPIRGKLGSLA